jgi:hypothetical protein
MENQFTNERSVPIDLRRYLDEAGRVVIWPGKSKLRDGVFAYLAALFEPGRVYSECEVNELLLRYLACNDYASVRRDLCDLRYLARERDGSRYWRATDASK